MQDLTKITTAVGLLDKETREALNAHPGPVELYTQNGTWLEWRNPHWPLTAIIRVQPAPLTKPSVDWSHVARDMNYLCQKEDRDGLFFSRKPFEKKWYGSWTDDDGGLGVPATFFASYVPGTCDWRDSLVIRPGYEGAE